MQLHRQLAHRGALGQRAWLVSYGLACALAAWACAGCSSLSHSKSDQVVRSRELACKGIDASQHGRHGEAETLFGQAIKMSPTDERLRRHYAESLWQRGAADEAVAQMEESVRLSGGSPELFVQLGEMYLGRGQVDLAASAAQRAIAGDARLAAAWALQGDVSRRRGESEAALAHYHRALSLDPNLPRAHLELAGVYREMARPQRALATLQALADRLPPGGEPVELLHQQGLALRELQRLEQSADVLAAAVQRGSPSVTLLTDLAETQLLAGRIDRAASAAEQAVALDPQHAAAARLLAQVQAQQQRMAASQTDGSLLPSNRF